MSTTHSFTVFKGDTTGKIVRGTTTRTINDDEVLVRVTHSGLCSTDSHFRNSGIVLGHEGVGVIEAVGPKCQNMKVGDVVGWGYLNSTCGWCQRCLSGKEIFCASPQMYGMHNHDQGSLATHAVWKEAFVFMVPPTLSPGNAAPLMCAGATVFSALYEHGANPTHTVGVVGIGGLGHLAIQFAAKMGCRVVVFSSTEGKREEAMKLGANEFYVTKDVEKLDVAHKIDTLLVTASHLPDWSLYMSIMMPQGSIFPLSIPRGDLKIPHMELLYGGIKIVGTIIASRWVQNAMLEFAARHQIQALIEEFPMTEEGITEAFERLDSGKVRYRAVLKN